MRVSPRAAVFVLLFSAACGGGRQVEVRTAPQPTVTAEQAVSVTNNLSQGVNISVTPTGSTELFLRQVPANTVERIVVQGVARGTSVTFKAVTVDGSRTYQSRTVPLNGTFSWPVP
ncbi:MAG: hypothetical protein JWM95_264 [Gemmatimonadetes bacterium]|nr:hypothetical protein [Gemmatimonadota bacterium]